MACAPTLAFTFGCGDDRRPARPPDNAAGAAHGGAGGEAGSGGSPEPVQACHEAAEAFCSSVYACLSPEELAALELPELVVDCVSEKEAQQGCVTDEPSALCEGFEPQAAARCAVEAASASCEDIVSGQEFAPHCNLVCEAP